jgi:hypothetical protein
LEFFGKERSKTYTDVNYVRFACDKAGST